MRQRNTLAFLVCLALVTAAAAQTPEATKAKGASKMGTSRAVIVPAADLKWIELDPSTPGVKIADVSGDHTKGAYGSFIQFPAGFSAPLHTHTHDAKIVVVSGTFITGPEGKPEVRLGPGSYLMQPGGNYRHTTKCDPASDCVFFTESNGKFDIHIVDAEKAPAKK